MTPFLALPGALSPEDCDRAIALAEAGPLHDAGLVRQTRDHGLRRAGIAWLDDLPEGEGLVDRLTAIVATANREGFGFDLTDFAESAQIARYGAESRGHYNWHSDIGTGALAAKRKLTVVVQLSDPAGYAGGRLELRPDSNIHLAPPTRGTATVFPSFVLHRVTPVTAGVRWSLTLWAHGPAFR
ncbi:MAG TPA: 2OG-Fe(II) oxygenase [Paracoccaceae bacterium]